MKFFPVLSFKVVGESMSPRYKNNQRVFVNKLAYVLGKPKTGDVVVVQHPFKKDTLILKRIAAGPGTEIYLQWGRLFFNKERVGDVHYKSIFFDEYGASRKKWDVPRHSYFVLGDNPTRSSDSRHFGPIHKDHIMGRVL